MSQNVGTHVIAPIVTPDSNDKFPTHINSMGQGGFKAVQTLAERDAIPMERRENGMLCAVLENDTLYQLKGGIDNAFWTIFATGAGGATTATDLPYTPTGNMVATNVQAAIDELESRKANIDDVYSKAVTDNKLANHTHDYATLTNTPDLSSLHDHPNKATIDKFTELAGELAWNGRTLGNMIADIYDADQDGIVDKAKTLEGLTVSADMLNYTAGLTGNIQAQINAISSGTTFKGEYDTYADMLSALPNPQKGYWVFIIADENHNGAKTQYYHDGNDWIYGGGASNIPNATDTVTGGIKLAGALGNPLGTSDNPLLADTGVTPGLYKSANIIVAEDGRITFAEDGDAAYIDDDVTSDETTWSSSKINDALNAKSDANHTHPQLHDPDKIGDIKVDMTTLANKRVIGYDAISGTAKWMEPPGGRVYVGAKSIVGDYRIVAGSYISLFIDENARTITINSTAGGGSAVPTLTEITHTELVPAGSSVFLDLDAAFNKYDIRTLEVSSDKSVTLDVEIFDSSAEPRRKIYQSNKEVYIYDIVNVPCHDKDESQKLHIKINNYGNEDANVSIVVVTTNLI